MQSHSRVVRDAHAGVIGLARRLLRRLVDLAQSFGMSVQVRLARRLVISNVWLLESDGKRYLFDTGYWLERRALRATLWQWGIRQKGDLDAVILTHRHSDHAGNAAWLRRTFDAPIVCHAADAAVLMGRARPPKLCGVAHQHYYESLLARVEDRLPSRVQVDEELSEGRWRDELDVVHAPGHTEGSIMLVHRPSATLFSGDVLLGGFAPLRLEHLSLAVPGFSLDVAMCHERVREFLRAKPRVDRLCAGHGPLVTNAAQKLDQLLRSMQ